MKKGRPEGKQEIDGKWGKEETSEKTQRKCMSKRKKGEKIRKQIETKWNEGTGKRVDRKQNGRIIPLILAFQRNDCVIVDAT